MKVSKLGKEVSIAALGGSGFIMIMLGIEAIASKGNVIMFMGSGVLLTAGAILIAKLIKV
jgi:hypothetical protein